LLKSSEIHVMSATEGIRFGPFSMDLEEGRLRRGGAELELRPQAIRALSVLILNSGRFVHPEQLMRDAWKGTSVSRNTITVTIAEVKKALQEYGSWIQCRPKRGYSLQVPKAEDLVQMGWHHWERRTREGMEKALACFEQAAREDGRDFRALEGVAASYLLLCSYSMKPPPEIYPKFRAAHQRAVELGGLTTALRSNHGHALHIFERKSGEAESELRQALRENPKQGTTYVRLAVLYASVGRLDAALDMVLQGRAVEPLCPVMLPTETFIRLCRREFDLAVSCGKIGVDLHPYQQVGRSHYAEALLRTGRVEEGLAEMRLVCTMSPDLPWLLALEATCLAKHGRPKEGLAILAYLKDLRELEYVDAYYMALLLDALGRRDEAFAELERARLENAASLFLLRVDVRADGLRGDPRFEPLARKVFRTPPSAESRRRRTRRPRLILGGASDTIAGHDTQPLEVR
jgi:DNA-binding winged helix-turn-helix (wHTH) protein/Flp pilus assembly protein TadD